MGTATDGRFRLAEATENELGRLEALECSCFSRPWSENAFRDALSKGDFFSLPIVYDGEELIGYAVLFCIFEDAELQNIAVDRRYRGQGLGAKLLDCCLEKARRKGAERIFLEVREGNTPARRLYEKCGFLFYGRRKNYYRDPVEDALLMVRSL